MNGGDKCQTNTIINLTTHPAFPPFIFKYEYTLCIKYDNILVNRIVRVAYGEWWVIRAYKLMDKIVEKLKAIAETKSNLIKSLQSIAGQFSIRNDNYAMNSLDEILRSTVRRVILQQSKLIFYNAQHNDKFDSFCISGNLFTIDTSEEARNKTSLDISILPRTSVQKVKIVHTVKIDTAGKYKQISLFAPQNIIKDNSFLDELIVVVFTTGYKWAEETIIGSISNDNETFIKDLYSYIRIVLPDEDVLSNFWFVCSCKGSSFYLVDDITAKSAIELLKRNEGNLTESPFKLVLK